jgi:hypothetical protein
MHLPCGPPSAVMPLVYCRIRTILHIQAYPRQSVPKTDCQPRRRSILDSLGLQPYLTSVSLPPSKENHTVSYLKRVLGGGALHSAV